MLHGMDPHGARGQGGGPLHLLHPAHVGIDDWLVRQVDAAELESMASRGGLDGEGDLLAGMQGGAFQRGRSRKGVFLVRVDGGHN